MFDQLYRLVRRWILANEGLQYILSKYAGHRVGSGASAVKVYVPYTIQRRKSGDSTDDRFAYLDIDVSVPK